VEWAAAGVMALAALGGGYLGARSAARMPVPVFRGVVLVIGLAAAIGLLLY